MRLQVLDPESNFSCGSCTACCNQPWHTYIEKEKADALGQQDFSRYPQLAGKKFFYASSEADEGTYVLAKGEGTKCLFLDHDGLCIIHKEMGSAAKPRMCLQFPYLPAKGHVHDRISVNYGCSAVQDRAGRPMTEQGADVAAIIPPRDKPPQPDLPVPFDPQINLTLAEGDALVERAMAIFGDDRDGDLWARFAEVLTMLAVVGSHKQTHATPGETDDTLVSMLGAEGRLPGSPEVPEITAYADARKAPSPARLLFAATIFRDTVPWAHAQKGLSFFRRVTLLPKLMSLAKLNGSYASMVLKRNVVIREVLSHELDPEMDPRAEQLLRRYYRVRFWHRLLVGTRLTVVAGMHQHIQDLNAIMFFARAEAQHCNEARLSEALIRKALNYVEFHFANQARAFDQKLVGYFQSQLQSLPAALQSLRLMALRQPVEASTV